MANEQKLKHSREREQTFILTDVTPALAWKVDKNKQIDQMD